MLRKYSLGVFVEILKIRRDAAEPAARPAREAAGDRSPRRQVGGRFLAGSGLT